MKKFLTDNMYWIVLIALVLAGFAVWKITRSNNGKSYQKKTNKDKEETATE